MTGHGVRLGGDGRLMVFRSSPPEDSARLRSTIDRLQRAAGAGAVDILAVVDDGERVELGLAFAGHALAAPMRGDALVPIAAALAGHLSDLHLRGLAHGAVRAEHVLVAANGCVRMCGFGSGDDATPADDVDAFGELVRSVLDAEDHSVTANALRFHARRCAPDDPTMRPSMAALAASLASVDVGGRSTPARDVHRSHRRWPLLASGAVALALSLAVVAAPRGSRADAPRDVAAMSISTSSTSSPPITTSTTTVEATRVWPATISGDGSTWDLGDVDDVVVLGDWDCDGVATPVLVERPTGAVWVVDRWPEGDAAPTRYVMTVVGAADVTVERIDGCDGLVIATIDDGEIRPALAPA